MINPHLSYFVSKSAFTPTDAKLLTFETSTTDPIERFEAVFKSSKQFEFPRGGTLLRPTMELYKNGDVKPADITIFITDGEFADLKEFPLIQKSCPRPGSTTFWIIDSDGKKRFKPLNRDDQVIYRRK